MFNPWAASTGAAGFVPNFAGKPNKLPSLRSPEEAKVFKAEMEKRRLPRSQKNVDERGYDQRVANPKPPLNPDEILSKGYVPNFGVVSAIQDTLGEWGISFGGENQNQKPNLADRAAMNAHITMREHIPSILTTGLEPREFGDQAAATYFLGAHTDEEAEDLIPMAEHVVGITAGKGMRLDQGKDADQQPIPEDVLAELMSDEAQEERRRQQVLIGWPASYGLGQHDEQMAEIFNKGCNLDIPDLVIIKAYVKKGDLLWNKEILVNSIKDEFSAMQRATSGPISVVASLMAEGMFDARYEEHRDYKIRLPLVLSYKDVPYEEFNKRLTTLGIL